MSKKYVQTNTFYLAGSGVIVGATSIVLTSFTDIYGNVLTMTDFGDTGYITLEPDTTNEESATFTGVTANANNTYTLTGVKTTLAKSPYTETSGLIRPHSGGTKLVVTDNVAFWNTFGNKSNTGTWTDVQTFASGATPTITDAPVANTDAANKAYVDGVAVAGAPNANTTTKGIVEQATQAEVDARTTTGSTGASLFINPANLRSVLMHDYAADAGANDTYAITLTPAPTVYTTGDVYVFKANTVNTGACTLNVNALGAKSLKMNKDLDPVDGYIKAGAVVVCVYDGTNMQIVSVSGKPDISQDSSQIYAVDSVGTDSYAITLTPAPTAYTSGMTVRFKAGTANTGTATLNVNGLGVKALQKSANTPLETGDIVSGQVVEAVYETTNDNFQVISPSSTIALYKNGTTTKNTADASTTQSFAHGMSKVPKKVKITFSDTGLTGGISGVMAYNGTTSSVVGSMLANAAYRDMNSSGSVKLYGPVSGAETEFQTGVITVDATNINIAWTKTGAPTGTANMMWEAEA